MTASQTVLQGHRYRPVIESLSKPKFAIILGFPAFYFIYAKVTLRQPVSPRRKRMMPEKSVPPWPCALKRA